MTPQKPAQNQFPQVYQPPVAPPPGTNHIRAGDRGLSFSRPGRRPSDIFRSMIWPIPPTIPQLNRNGTVIAPGTTLYVTNSTWSSIDRFMGDAMQNNYIRESELPFLRVPLGSPVTVIAIFRLFGSDWIQAIQGAQGKQEGLVPLHTLSAAKPAPNAGLKQVDQPWMFPLHEQARSFSGYIRRGYNGAFRFVYGVMYIPFLRWKEGGIWRENILTAMGDVQKGFFPEIQIAINRQIESGINRQTENLNEVHVLSWTHGTGRLATKFILAFINEQARDSFYEDLSYLHDSLTAR